MIMHYFCGTPLHGSQSPTNFIFIFSQFSIFFSALNQYTVLQANYSHQSPNTVDFLISKPLYGFIYLYGLQFYLLPVKFLPRFLSTFCSNFTSFLLCWRRSLYFLNIQECVIIYILFGILVLCLLVSSSMSLQPLDCKYKSYVCIHVFMCVYMCKI